MREREIRVSIRRRSGEWDKEKQRPTSSGSRERLSSERGGEKVTKVLRKVDSQSSIRESSERTGLNESSLSEVGCREGGGVVVASKGRGKRGRDDAKEEQVKGRRRWEVSSLSSKLVYCYRTEEGHLVLLTFKVPNHGWRGCRKRKGKRGEGGWLKERERRVR